MSTFSLPYHLRASAAAMSGLFCASAEITSIGLPNIEPPNSSMAILVASTLPWPPMSE